MTLLEATNGGGYSGLGKLIASLILMIASPAIILFIIAIFLWKKKRKIAKRLLIAGFLYLLVAGGICGIVGG